jgi:benzoyl-CoA reductase/2-hydroxyglutaryl-CoA dehydratase subunit BcrC/BadD/HgdB
METAEENGFSQDICSFIRTAAGAAIEDIFPTPDFLATTSHLCDPSAKFASYAALKYRRPEFVLDIPYGIYEGVYLEDVRRVNDAVDYLAGQFEDLVRFIEAHTGAGFDLERFKQTIQWSNQARYWVQKGNAVVRDKGTTAFTGSKDIDFAVNLMQTWGAPEVIDVYKSRHDEFAKGAEAGHGIPDSPRILWYHLKPYYKNSLMSYIEKQIPIYATMVNFIYWDEMDPDDPFRSLARKTLLSPGYCPVSVRANLTAKRMRQGDGVIAFYPKSCRHFHSSAHIEAHTFKSAGIPFLAIDGDCIDNRGDDFAVLQTRLDRFIKKLHKGKNNKTA